MNSENNALAKLNDTIMKFDYKIQRQHVIHRIDDVT